MFDNMVRDGTAKTANSRMFIYHKDRVRCLNSVGDCITVKRFHRMHIEETNIDAVLFKRGGGLQAMTNRRASRDDGDLLCLTKPDGLADFKIIILGIDNWTANSTGEADIDRMFKANTGFQRLIDLCAIRWGDNGQARYGTHDCKVFKAIMRIAKKTHGKTTAKRNQLHRLVHIPHIHAYLFAGAHRGKGGER